MVREVQLIQPSGRDMKRNNGLCAFTLVALALVLVVPSQAYGATKDGGTVYRLYNVSNGMHHYTMDANEYDVLGDVGWQQEGSAWVAPAQDASSTPVYRLYNPSSGDHLYTADANEYKTLASLGWKQEGVCWYSAAKESGVPIYRLFNPNEVVGTHLYTLDSNEYKTLGGLGWNQENVAWYGLAAEARTPIMGASTATVSQMVSYFESKQVEYPANVYTQYGAASIGDFCDLLVKAANAEGVNAEVLFAQVMLETGNLQFGGQVKANQCNFGGLGATDGGASGADFSSYGKNAVYTGLLAQAQHLKAYASTQPLNEQCVDPRFNLVTRGKAPYVENLGGGNWATDPNYASKLLNIMSAV